MGAERMISMQTRTWSLLFGAMIESQGFTLSSYTLKKSKVTQRKEIIKIKAAIYEIENRIIIGKNQWFEEITKIGKSCSHTD